MKPAQGFEDRNISSLVVIKLSQNDPDSRIMNVVTLNNRVIGKKIISLAFRTELFGSSGNDPTVKIKSQT
jgi:hypothetical protein